MSKRVWSSLVLAVSLTAPGCRMCCPSYDYCGPLDPMESNSECCGMARRGSIFNGYVSEETPHAVETETGATPTVKETHIEAKLPSSSSQRPTLAPQLHGSAGTNLPPTAQKSSSRRQS